MSNIRVETAPRIAELLPGFHNRSREAAAAGTADRPFAVVVLEEGSCPFFPLSFAMTLLILSLLVYHLYRLLCFRISLFGKALNDG